MMKRMVVWLIEENRYGLWIPSDCTPFEAEAAAKAVIKSEFDADEQDNMRAALYVRDSAYMGD